MLFLHGDGGGGFLGYDLPRLHAALNDFPPALLVAAVIFEILFLLTKRDSLRIAAYWTLLAGVIGAGLAVLSGLGAEDKIAHGEAVHEIMEEHEELAFITTGIFAVVAIWRLWRERVMSRGERMAALLSRPGRIGLPGFHRPARRRAGLRPRRGNHDTRTRGGAQVSGAGTPARRG